MDPHKPAARRVAVVITTEMDCFREMLRGVHGYAIGQGRAWHLDVLSPADDYLDFIHTTKPDGVLVSTTFQPEEDHALLHACPSVVALGSQFRRYAQERDVVEFDADNREIGRVAAKYFITKGFKSFLFVGTDAFWSDERERGFREAIEAAKHTLHVYREEPSPQRGRTWGRPRFNTVLAAGDALAEQMASLPQPLAVLCCNDVRGRAVVELCLMHGLRVPEQVAVLGVDNDALECELAHPPLSSVATPWRKLGERAAEMLDRMIDAHARPANGKPAKVAPGFHPVAPLGVIERQSTDVVAIGDDDVAAAIRYIRDHAHRRIGVTDVLTAVPIARRALEKRFRDQLGRSPLEEIRRVRVDRARQLLAQTELPMPQVADRCGFATAAWFSSAFRALTGETPSAYRERNKA